MAHTLLPTSCISRVVGDSQRDPLYLELIHAVIGDTATAQHTITHPTIIRSSALLLTDLPIPLSTLKVL